jgi:hypothetical protein
MAGIICNWHLHLTYDDGTEICRTELGSEDEIEYTMEGEEREAAALGRTIVGHRSIKCAADNDSNYPGHLDSALN